MSKLRGLLRLVGKVDWRVISYSLIISVVLSSCNAHWPVPVTPTPNESTIFDINRRLGRGINLGDALEAPNEGEWRLTLREEFFPTIADAGFDSIRVPIRWTTHATDEPPYTIDPVFFERIDWVLENAKRNNLLVVINHHHYEQVISDPLGQHDKFVAMWRQIATRYKDQPDSVIFELLNEASGQLSANHWNTLATELIGIIRETNPTRAIIVGPVEYNKIQALPLLKLPKDPNLIVTFHYYEPFSFTMQGAEWMDGAKDWLGTTWDATPAQKLVIEHDFARVATWARANARPIYLGEFGAIDNADMESRIRWSKAVAEVATKNGFSIAYWEFASEFGMYNLAQEAWSTELLKAVLGE